MTTSWSLVVPPGKFDDADRMWRTWVEQYGQPPGNDVRVDIVHTSAGDRRRYLVRPGPRTNHGHPAAWKSAGYTGAEIAAAAVAMGWSPIFIIKFLKTEMGVSLGDAKILVDQQLPADVQLANAQLRAIAEFSLRISPEATDSDIEELESKTQYEKKIRALVAADRYDAFDTLLERFDDRTTSFHELSELEARAIVEQYVSDLRIEVDVEVSGGHEFDFGWIFYYQSTEYLQTREMGTQLVGQGPILIDRFTATLWAMGSALTEELCVENYRATGDPTRPEISANRGGHS